MKLGAWLRTTFYRRDKLPPLAPSDRRPPSWAADPRLAPDREDMRNRRSADAFGMGYLDGGGFADGGGGGNGP